MWKSKLKKDNEFLKRLVAVILPKTDVCEICVFYDTLPQICELDCEQCESLYRRTSACCGCKDNSNFLWNGKSPK